jgi:hypothetical protein
MAVTLEQFQEYVGTDETTFPQDCLNTGHALVTRYIGDVTGVPTHIHNQAVLNVASELFHRRSAPMGIAQFASNEGAPTRVARDPMISVYPLLLPYVGFGV